MRDDSVKVKLGNKHPVGMTLSGNRVKKSIKTIKKSGLAKHASSEKRSSPYEPYDSNQIKFLNKKDKKNSVHDDGEISIAGLPERKPERAKIGEIVRFMYNPENSHSPYWMQ